MTAVLFAMREERDAFLTLCEETEMIRETMPFIYRCKLEGRTMMVALSGVGKTQAAIAATLLVSRKRPDAMISVGVAGGVNTEPGTLVIPSKTLYHDVDTTAFDACRLGQVPGMPPFFECDEALRELAIKAAKEEKASWTDGTIVTGDAFLSDPTRLLPFWDAYPDIRAVDMETAAIAHVAHIESIPFLAIRTISDVVGAPSQTDDYNQFMKEAARISANILKAVVSAG